MYSKQEKMLTFESVHVHVTGPGEHPPREARAGQHSVAV